MLGITRLYFHAPLHTSCNKSLNSCPYQNKPIHHHPNLLRATEPNKKVQCRVYFWEIRCKQKAYISWTDGRVPAKWTVSQVSPPLIREESLNIQALFLHTHLPAVTWHFKSLLHIDNTHRAGFYLVKGEAPLCHPKILDRSLQKADIFFTTAGALSPTSQGAHTHTHTLVF